MPCACSPYHCSLRRQTTGLGEGGQRRGHPGWGAEPRAQGREAISCKGENNSFIFCSCMCSPGEPHGQV